MDNNFEMSSLIYINSIELILLGFALILIYFLALKNTKSIKNSILLSILLVLPLYLSIEGMSQFVTTDEHYIIMETVDVQNSDMKQWGWAYRTSHVTIGTFLSLFQELYIGSTMDVNELIILAKGLRWFFAFLIIIAIYYLINKHYILENQRNAYFIIYFYSILMLPISVLAVKLAIYDTYSLLFGALTVVLLLVTFKTESKKYALLSIIIGMLAAQEKLIASPVLLLSFIVFTYINFKKANNIKFIAVFYFSIYALLIAIVTSLTSFLIVSIISRGDFIPGTDFSSIVYPIISYLSPILRIFEGGGFRLNHPTIYLLLFTGVISGVLALFLLKFSDWIKNSFFPFANKYIKLIMLIAFLSVLLLGIIGTYQLEIFLHPYYPVQAGNYLPSHSMNGYTIHFGADSYFKHTIFFLAAAYSKFMNAIPSIYIGILLLILIFRNRKSSQEENIDFFCWRIVLLGMLAVPLLYGLANIPLKVRYYNLFIFLVILVLGLEFNRFLSIYSNRIITSTYVFIFIMALTIELLPFRAIFGFFIPIWHQPTWSQYTTEYNNPLPGRNYIGWWAIGEEVFFVGKQIEKMVAKNQISQQHDIRIYGGPDWFMTGSYALWLTPPEFIKNCPPKKTRLIKSSYYQKFIFASKAVVPNCSARFTNSDFYTFTRRATAQLKSYCKNKSNIRYKNKYNRNVCHFINQLQ